MVTSVCVFVFAIGAEGHWYPFQRAPSPADRKNPGARPRGATSALAQGAFVMPGSFLKCQGTWALAAEAAADRP